MLIIFSLDSQSTIQFLESFISHTNIGSLRSNNGLNDVSSIFFLLPPNIFNTLNCLIMRNFIQVMSDFMRRLLARQLELEFWRRRFKDTYLSIVTSCEPFSSMKLTIRPLCKSAMTSGVRPLKKFSGKTDLSVHKTIHYKSLRLERIIAQTEEVSSVVSYRFQSSSQVI